MDSLRARDPDALASFYDGRAGKVREYCSIICPPQFVDEATFVAFRDFLGRLEDPGSRTDLVDLDELLWKSTRGAAAGRAEVRANGQLPTSQRSSRRGASPYEPQATCLAMPELLAAYASGELHRNGALDKHVVECPICRVTATRFRAAEAAFAREPREQPSKAIRRAWLQIAVNAVDGES